MRKEGPAYDLPIALGVLIATGQIPPECLDGSLVMGELSLDGSVRHMRGVLPMAAMARSQGFKRVFVPSGGCPKPPWLLPDLEVIPVENLSDLVDHLSPVPVLLHPTRRWRLIGGSSLPGGSTPPILVKSKVRSMSNARWRWRLPGA